MGYGLTIRGDSYYCPLSFSLDSYWNCEADCWHCYLRRLNRTWGQDLRPIDPEELERKLVNGLKSNNPKSSLAWAIKHKKTIRFGNKSDPYQTAEYTHLISNRILKIFRKLNWTYVIQTMFLGVLERDFPIIYNSKDICTVMPIISPGLESDWEILERGRTTPIGIRLRIIRDLIKNGVKVGVNGEPFIPGYHTVEQFEDTIKLLKSIGVKSYNTYNFHFNEFVAKRLAYIGINVEKIWKMNRDQYWKPIQIKLIDISKKHDIILGCPDFVNSGKDYFQKCNTCCGIDVANPCTFNTHVWKRGIQENDEFIFQRSYDGIGDFEEGKKIFEGKTNEFYTMKDAGFGPVGFGL